MPADRYVRSNDQNYSNAKQYLTLMLFFFQNSAELPTAKMDCGLIDFSSRVEFYKATVRQSNQIDPQFGYDRLITIIT